MSVRSVATGGVIVLAVLTVVTIGAASAEFGLATEGSISIPDRTIPVGGSDFTVDQMARVSTGDRIVVHVTAARDGHTTLLLYDSDRRAVRRFEGSGARQVRVSTENLDAGAYMLVLVGGDPVRAIHPVVVSRYEVRVGTPEFLPRTDEVAVPVTVTPDLTGEGSSPVVHVV